MKDLSKIIYTEGDREVHIDVEMQAGPIDMVIYSNSLKNWEKPFDSELLTQEELVRIKERVNEDMKQSKLNVEWE